MSTPDEFAIYQFKGRVIHIAEKELAASFADDKGGALVTQIYDDYVRDGRPKNERAWIRKKVVELFPALGDRPVWVESMTLPTWPFLQGRPMVFIRQFEIPRSDFTETVLAGRTVLYIFGGRAKLPEGGWRMEYRVIEQDPDLRE